MCIVVDANALPSVFDVDCRNHDDFEPVLEWILEGRGFIVYGGSKYKEELRRANKYLKLLAELRRASKVVCVNDNLVDREEEYLQGMEPSASFDDRHIVAIFRVSYCRLLCSLDKRSDRFVTDRRFYNRGQRRPSIYRNRGHARLLCNQNIVNIRNVD